MNLCLSININTTESGHPKEKAFDRKFLTDQMRVRDTEGSRKYPLLYSLIHLNWGRNFSKACPAIFCTEMQKIAGQILNSIPNLNTPPPENNEVGNINEVGDILGKRGLSMKERNPPARAQPLVSCTSFSTI